MAIRTMHGNYREVAKKCKNKNKTILDKINALQATDELKEILVSLLKGK